MREKVPVEKLAVGMFVAELDRPWLDTPFMIEGFVIESEAQILEFRQYCKHVFVERALSTGKEYREEPKEQVVAKKAQSPMETSMVRVQGAAKKKPEPRTKTGLFQTLMEILRSAFSKPDSAREQPKTSEVTTNEKQPDGGPRVSRGGVVPAQRISEEELGFIKPVDPAESIRIAQESAQRKPGGWAGFLRRLKRWFSTKRSAADSVRNAAPVDVEVEPAAVYPDKATFEEELPQAQAAHEKAQVAVQEVIADIQKNRSLQLEKVNDAVNWMVESVVRNPDGLIWLTRLKTVDTYTYDHGLNTAIYLIAFGRHLGLPQDQLQMIGTVGMMQDVGKIRLPRELLEKRENYTASEYKVAQSHVQHSIDIIKTSQDASGALINIVAQHHERYDGSGYPNGLEGDQITMLGGMAGLIDTYTAMVSVRPHKEPLSVQAALQQLYNLRDHSFKADLVEEFIQCIGVFPVGSLVELNTAEVAVVVAQNRTRRLKPRVMLVLDHERQEYPTPVMLDLIYDPPTPSGEPYRIVRGLQAGAYEFKPEDHFAAFTETR